MSYYQNHIRRLLVTFCTWTAVLVLVSASILLVSDAALAYRVEGRVLNGTTGQPVVPATIKILNPSMGMASEREVATLDDQGHFVVEDLHDHDHVMLLRVEHDGVNYTEIVRATGEEVVKMDISVFELTSSWDNLHVTIPHLVARRSHDTLTVDRTIQVMNHTSPPRTVSGTDAAFKLYLPEDRLQINALYVTSLGVPVSVHPDPTETPGVYAVNYPLRPGITQFSVSFDAPYANGRYTYNEKLQYDINDVLVLTQNPSLEITSKAIPIERVEDFHGFAAYETGSLARGSTLSIEFTGGELTESSRAASQAQAQGGAQVLILPNRMQNASLVVILGLLLILVLMMAFATKTPLGDAEEATLFLSRKDELLGQTARLDDLYETGTISPQLYNLKRTELMGMLAQLVYRTDFAEKPKSGHPKSKKGAARA
jgi:hypothetical protein